jgi:hypothetical protein
MNPSAVSDASARSFDVLARRWARPAALVLGIVVAIVSAGLAWQQEWATDLWPWPDVRMTYIFLASIGAAIVTPLIWAAVTNEIGSLIPVFLLLALGQMAIGVYFSIRLIRHDETMLASMIIFSFLSAAVMTYLYQWSLHIPLDDQRGTPRYVQIAFLLFEVVLIPVGLALILQADNVFPWDLEPQTSTVIGFIFWSAAVLFAWCYLHPDWAYAGPALAGFLAYDLVLIVPYIDMLLNRDTTKSMYGASGEEVNIKSLVVYIPVILFSGAVAAWAIFVDRRTRVWGRGSDAKTM